MVETRLRELGIHRVPIPIPFPQAGGPVNVYLVADAGGGVLMFDSGLGTPEALAALEEGFRAAGHQFDGVTRIVLSHGHVDHFGAALTVMERAGRTIPVFAHPADLPKISAAGPRWRDLVPRYVAHLATLGVPPDVLEAVSREAERGSRLARRVPEVTPLQPGAVLRARSLALEVQHMPGHTPGLICLHERRQRLFFSADHLLEKISPNPLIELGPEGSAGTFRPLVAYLDSVARLRELDVDLVLPGHGPPFSGHREVIGRLLSFYERRQERVRETLRGGARTAYEVAQALFPFARPADAFLVVSETVANLEVLEARGAVARERSGEVVTFRLTPQVSAL